MAPATARRYLRGMAKFIRLTRIPAPGPVLVNVNAVRCVVTEETGSRIFLTGPPEDLDLKVAESVATIEAMVRGDA